MIKKISHSFLKLLVAISLFIFVSLEILLVVLIADFVFAMTRGDITVQITMVN